MAPLPDLSRRALLAGAAGSVLLSGCGTSSGGGAPVDGSTLTQIAYAPRHPDQYGVLGVPAGTPKGLAVLVHGGFWLQRYGAKLMDPIAADLRRRGYATWNIEYRRIGTGGAFPTTFTDVAAAFDKVPDLGLPAHLPRFSIGHSAGGQLAVWAASRSHRTPGGPPTGTVGTTIALSGVLDLAAAADAGLGGGAVQALMGSRPIDNAGSYPRVDPCQLVPARGRVIAVHAENDTIVPRSQSSTYVRLGRAAGGRAELVSVPGGHFDLIDPQSAAWKQILTRLPGQ